MRTVEAVELVALKCPQCGAQMEGLICGYCGTGFKEVSAPEKAENQVTEEGGRPRVGNVHFNKRVGFGDEQLVAIAGQVAGAMAGEPGSQDKHFLAFTLPLPPKSGRPPALFVEAHRGDDEKLTVLFENGFPAEMHQRLQAEGRVLSLPQL